MITPTIEIRQSLYRRLLCALPICGLTEKDIAWPNASFKTSVKKMYLSPFCLFGETTTASLSKDGFELLAGVFQITIFGLLHTGEAQMEQVARELIELYRSGTRIDVPGYEQLLINQAYRGNMTLDTGGRNDMTSEMARPQLVVSAHWQHYVPKGE